MTIHPKNSTVSIWAILGMSFGSFDSGCLVMLLQSPSTLCTLSSRHEFQYPLCLIIHSTFVGIITLVWVVLHSRLNLITFGSIFYSPPEDHYFYPIDSRQEYLVYPEGIIKSPNPQPITLLIGWFGLCVKWSNPTQILAPNTHSINTDIERGIDPIYLFLCSEIYSILIEPSTLRDRRLFTLSLRFSIMFQYLNHYSSITLIRSTSYPTCT